MSSNNVVQITLIIKWLVFLNRLAQFDKTTQTQTLGGPQPICLNGSGLLYK